MPDISQITLPSGNTYDLADSAARQDIEDLKDTVTGVMHWEGITTTDISGGSTATTIVVDGENREVTAGSVAGYGELEYAFNGTSWQKFGPEGAFGALAFKSSASGSYTPSGTVSTPTITITPTEGTVDEVTNVGSMPTYTVNNGVLTITAGQTPTTSSKTVMTGASATSSQPTFSGDADTVTVS